MLRTCPLVLASDLSECWILFVVCMQRGTINADLFLFPGKCNIYNSKANFTKQRKEWWTTQFITDNSLYYHCMVKAPTVPEKFLWIKVYFEVKIIFKGESPTLKQQIAQELKVK